MTEWKNVSLGVPFVRCKSIMGMGSNSIGCVLETGHKVGCKPPKTPDRCTCGCTDVCHHEKGCNYHDDCKRFTYDKALTMRGPKPR